MPQMSTGTKVALVGAVGIGAYLLASSSSAKAAPASTPAGSDCASLTKSAASVLASATAKDVDALQVLLKQAQALGCTDLADQIGKKLTALTAAVVAPPPKPSVTFNPANAPDPVRANSLAWAIAKAVVPSPPDAAWAASHPSGIDPASGTFNTLKDYGDYPGNLGSILAFQQASGIPADGRVGPVTNAAFSYFLKTNARPDGSTDVRPYAGSVSGDSFSKKLCVSCGSEMNPSIAGSCCGSCAKGQACESECIEMTPWVNVGQGLARMARPFRSPFQRTFVGYGHSKHRYPDTGFMGKRVVTPALHGTIQRGSRWSDIPY